ncbi:Non-specific lipid-transfer protein 10 [Striga hermonthica]|uniref:Non-specific lipid-transfer protein n=1 Tax=Striga hermonthica TaxID=68872 RepID=A0A9N7NSY2_STRHE|nr:Non-specific lipid-transfer protein 10 [Striga hermonthica]
MAGQVKSLYATLIAAVLLAVVMSPPAEAVVSCGTVASNLTPCIPYVTRGGALGGCCNGVKRLYGAATTTADRQTVCRCLKNLANAYRGVDLGKAAKLPSQCGVNVAYKISPSTDCNRVN